MYIYLTRKVEEYNKCIFGRLRDRYVISSNISLIFGAYAAKIQGLLYSNLSNISSFIIPMAQSTII